MIQGGSVQGQISQSDVIDSYAGKKKSSNINELAASLITSQTNKLISRNVLTKSTNMQDLPNSMSHSSDDDSDEEMKPMRMKIGPTSYITKRNSGLAVSEASDPHETLPENMVDQNNNLTTTSKQLLEPANITGVSNDDLMISESKSRINQSPVDNNLSINNTSMIQNFMMDKEQIDLTSSDLKLTGAPSGAPRPKKSEPDEKIDVDWTMDLPALNITR
jgi:hypothetical protein